MLLQLPLELFDLVDAQDLVEEHFSEDGGAVCGERGGRSFVSVEVGENARSLGTGWTEDRTGDGCGSVRGVKINNWMEDGLCI